MAVDVRPFRDGDAGRLDDLLDPGAERLWRGQGHRLHGPARDGQRWRRTVVAEDAGDVVGAASVAVNPVHPGRYNAAVEIAASRRRAGLGAALLTQLRRLRPEPLALSGKVREADSAASGFVRAAGGRTYQRCLCPTVRLDAVAPWCAGRTVPRVTVAPFSAADALIDAFADLYRWLHAPWSPVGGVDALREVARQVCVGADSALSRVAYLGGLPVALALAFRDGDRVEVVAETVAADTPDGADVLAAAIAATLAAARAAGVLEAEFDGHVDDPHLAPLIATMPLARTDPLLLVELP